jgi:hypothetical protein
MKFALQIYHLIRADFLERVRRFSFLVVAGMTLFAGYMFVPPSGAPYTSFVIASHRGYYNSPWVGTLFGVTAVTLLALIGFYLVKNSISRDYDTRVGQIIATTPLKKITYMIGKWISNILVLSVILGLLTLIAPVMQLVRAEVAQVDLIALWTPIWLLGFPALVFVAALAVLFESIAFLRGGLGNIIYFFIWGPLLIGSSTRSFIGDSKAEFIFDFGGLTRIVLDIKEHLTAAGIDTSKGIFGVIGPIEGESVNRFVWEGIQWTPEMTLERLIWVGLAVLVTAMAAIPFNRFDPAGNKIIIKGGNVLSNIYRQGKKHPGDNGTLDENRNNNLSTFSAGKSAAKLTPVKREKPQTSFIPLIRAELLLMLKGHKWWWYIIVLGLIIPTPFIPIDYAAQMLFALASIWPILVWSKMGIREIKYQTYQTVFSVAFPLRRQFPAILIAGVFISFIMSSGYAARMIISGGFEHLYAIAIGAIFVPSMALALGVWTNGSRAFEIVYLVLWYMSIQSGATAFDYRGATGEAISSGIPFYYLVIAVILVVLAVIGRKKQIFFL